MYQSLSGVHTHPKASFRQVWACTCRVLLQEGCGYTCFYSCVSIEETHIIKGRRNVTDVFLSFFHLPDKELDCCSERLGDTLRSQVDDGTPLREPHPASCISLMASQLRTFWAFLPVSFLFCLSRSHHIAFNLHSSSSLSEGRWFLLCVLNPPSVIVLKESSASEVASELFQRSRN